MRRHLLAHCFPTNIHLLHHVQMLLCLWASPRFLFHALYDKATTAYLIPLRLDLPRPPTYLLERTILRLRRHVVAIHPCALLRYSFFRIPTMFSLSPQSCSRLPVFHLFGLMLLWRMLLIMGIPTKRGVGFQNKDRGKMRSISTRATRHFLHF